MDNKTTKISWINPASAKEIHPRAGYTYQFMADVSTRGGHIHPKNSLLFVHCRTTDNPHNEVGPRGYNWYCRTQYGVSIWSTLEHCIERGLLRRLTIGLN